MALLQRKMRGDIQTDRQIADRQLSRCEMQRHRGRKPERLVLKQRADPFCWAGRLIKAVRWIQLAVLTFLRFVADWRWVWNTRLVACGGWRWSWSSQADPQSV